MGWTPQAAPRPAQAPAHEPTAVERLWLAIVSLVVLVPLVAICAGTFGMAGGLVGITLVSLAVVAINVVFNADLMEKLR